METTVITVKLFGPVAQQAARRSVDLSFSHAAVTCAQVLRQLAQADPALARLLPSHRLAVNSEFARDDQPVNAEDDVALIGMVSGG